MATRKDEVLIELASGRKVWATPRFHVQVREQVLVSWDYTRDRVRDITTQKRLDSAETKQEAVERAMSDGFHVPSSEDVVMEGDINDLDVETRSSNETDEESDVSEERRFPIPSDEDVDRDDIVLLRDDIHII